MRPMRTSDGAITWEDFDGAPMTSLLAKFRMPKIEMYTGIDCTSIHLRLYSFICVEEGIARILWPESSPIDSKRKKPLGGQRSRSVSAISSAMLRPLRHYQTVGQTSRFYYPPSPHVQYRPPALSRPMTPTYLHPISQFVFVVHVIKRPPIPYTRPRAS
ncbi:hypothetical protein CK203_110534 [Vitis vinifera]|uniref:Uncharacterized protein n=1 Tax=Vitis vinifera TaxID=29760 RepID=A0A438CSG9_VITVI|nr:hypothetical protein CK203_110534 [Vitis vinifera]